MVTPWRHDLLSSWVICQRCHRDHHFPSSASWHRLEDVSVKVRGPCKHYLYTTDKSSPSAQYVTRRSRKVRRSEGSFTGSSIDRDHHANPTTDKLFPTSFQNVVRIEYLRRRFTTILRFAFTRTSTYTIFMPNAVRRIVCSRRSVRFHQHNTYGSRRQAPVVDAGRLVYECE